MDGEEVVKLKDAAKALGCSPRTLRRLDQEGKIRCVKSPQGVRTGLLKGDVDRMLERKAAGKPWVEPKAKQEAPEPERLKEFLKRHEVFATIATGDGSEVRLQLVEDGGGRVRVDIREFYKGMPSKKVPRIPLAKLNELYDGIVGMGEELVRRKEAGEPLVR